MTHECVNDIKTMKFGEVASKIRMGKKRRDQVSDS